MLHRKIGAPLAETGRRGKRNDDTGKCDIPVTDAEIYRNQPFAPL
ncbi:hypothetical protein WBP07_11125 [Novosphingobium sp. BL-8A]